MHRIPLPFTDTVLLLSPRWEGWPWLYVAGALVLCLLVPLLLVLLYRYELRLVGHRLTALGLLGLRLVLVFFLLFVVFLQPIVARSSTEELPGRVIIAVDRSDSMDVADPQRPAVEKLRLARALKLAGDLCPDAQLDAWIRQYEEKGTPEWVGKDESPDDPARRQQLADQRRYQHDQVCQRIDGLTRSQVSQRVLDGNGARVLDSIAGKHKVELLGFAQEAWNVKPDQVNDLFQPSPSPPGQPAAPPSGSRGDRTDLHLPLERALERSGKGEGTLLGVVLLTDGQHNWQESPVAKAIELGQQHIPIYPVALGASQAPRDVALADLKAPAVVFKDVDTTVEARFKVSGLPKQDIVVELQMPAQADGRQPPPLQQRIHHDGKDAYHTVTFQVRLDQVGTQTLIVTAKPVEGEIRSDNNGGPVVINVADDKAKVLLVDGEARWEYHYLANALLRDRTMQVQSVVFNQPRLGKIAEDELQKMGNPRLILPTEPDALAAYDCIVLGDVSPSQLPLSERVRLEKYVADRGGTLVIVAGKRFMPLAFEETESAGPAMPPTGDIEQGDPLLRLLPVVEPRAVRPTRGFPLTLTGEGKLAAFLQMDPAADPGIRSWADLPRQFWGVVGRAKPAAVPLAYLASETEAGNQEKEDPEKDPGRQKGLIVRQNYGFGRVLFVGLESTWRWRYKVGDTYHHRFWGQVIRWAASDKPLVAGNDSVRFGTREPVYRQGEDVSLVVRLGDDVRPLAADALVGARVLRQDGDGKEAAVALVPLKRNAFQTRLLEGTVRNLPKGRYRMDLAIPDLAGYLQGPAGPDGKPAGLQAGFTVAPAPSQEMVELATNWPLLEELATKSGGQVYTPENASELAEKLTRTTITRERPTERKIWQEWGTLGFCLLLLTVEWVGRKLAGLP